MLGNHSVSSPYDLRLRKLLAFVGFPLVYPQTFVRTESVFTNVTVESIFSLLLAVQLEDQHLLQMEGFASFPGRPSCVWHFAWRKMGLASSWSCLEWPRPEPCPLHQGRRRRRSQLWGRSGRPSLGQPASSDMETMSDFLWNKSLACISVFIFNCADFLSQISVCNHREPLVPKIGKNHWKTIVANGWSDQKPSMVMVRNFQNHRHSIAGEKKPSPFHRHEKLTIVPVYCWYTLLLDVRSNLKFRLLLGR